MRFVLAAILLGAAAEPASADRAARADASAHRDARTDDAPSPPLGDCYAELDARHVRYKRAKRPGIALGVEIVGPLGGVEISGREPLVIDCSLAVSLDEAGRYIRDQGLARATFMSPHRTNERPLACTSRTQSIMPRMNVILAA